MSSSPVSWITKSLALNKPPVTKARRGGKLSAELLNQAVKQEERLEALVMSTPYAIDANGHRLMLVGIVPSTLNPNSKVQQAVIIALERTERQWADYHAIDSELERLQYRQRLGELCLEKYPCSSDSFPSIRFLMREDPSPAFAEAVHHGTVTNFNKFSFRHDGKRRTYLKLSKRFDQ